MNKKMFLTLILAILLGFSAFAQTYSILVKPAGSKEWGYADLKGNMIIEAKYKKCIGFSENGLAAIYDSKEKAFYFIDMKGERLPTEVEKFKLIEVFGFGMKGFNDERAPVKIEDQWGYLDTEGKLVIQAKYDKVTIFNNGFAGVQRDGKYFALAKNGEEFPVEAPGIKDLNRFSEQLASYKTEAGLVGFVDGSGKSVIEPKFKSAGDFHGGLAWAKTPDGSVGYINPVGEWAINPKFEAGKNYDPETGMVRIKLGGKWGYSNKEGSIYFMNDSDICEDFFSGLARGKKDKKSGYYNAKMEWVIQPQFDGARDAKNGYASVKQGDFWGVIDANGDWVIQPKFEDIKDVEVIN